MKRPLLGALLAVALGALALVWLWVVLVAPTLGAR